MLFIRFNVLDRPGFFGIIQEFLATVFGNQKCNNSIANGSCGFQAAITKSEISVLAAGSGTYNQCLKNYPPFIEILLINEYKNLFLSVKISGQNFLIIPIKNQVAVLTADSH